MKKIFICSPLSGDIEYNINKAISLCRGIALGGNIPIAPHVYFTQFLFEGKEEERELGISFGLELLKLCDEMYVFGVTTKGMRREIDWWQNNMLKEGKPLPYYMEI